MAMLLDGFDTRQLTAIAEFLARSSNLAYDHIALLRAHAAIAPRTLKK
jgi:hypothetical protein